MSSQWCPYYRDFIVVQYHQVPNSPNCGERFLELCTFYCLSYVPCYVAEDFRKQRNLPGHNSHALSYQVPGIFLATYESKESFEPIGMFRS